MRATLVLVAGLWWLGCSSNSPAPSGDGAAGHGAAGHDGAVDSNGGSKMDVAGGMDGPADAPDAPATACPTEQPGFGVTCTGTLKCFYGHTTCCGVETSDQTCTCDHGFFDCAQTTECNFTCPDAGQG